MAFLPEVKCPLHLSPLCPHDVTCYMHVHLSHAFTCQCDLCTNPRPRGQGAAAAYPSRARRDMLACTCACAALHGRGDHTHVQSSLPRKICSPGTSVLVWTPCFVSQTLPRQYTSVKQHSQLCSLPTPIWGVLLFILRRPATLNWTQSGSESMWHVSARLCPWRDS